LCSDSRSVFSFCFVRVRIRVCLFFQFCSRWDLRSFFFAFCSRLVFVRFCSHSFGANKRTIDLGVVLRKFIEEENSIEKYGYLPQMAIHSYFGTGSLQASSFSERVNSAANLVLTEGNSLLSDDEINMCSVLCINKLFKQFCRQNYLASINAGNRSGPKGKKK